MKPSDYQLVLTTCPNEPAAEKLANALVVERLAACVNILPIKKSVYLWKGKLESSAEVLLLIKSAVRRYRFLQKRILELHPYELPEVVAVPFAAGFRDYLAWIDNPEHTR
jgi:periplasmic divalent cation tolerance protein